MFVVLWEFDVKPGNEQRFESVYGQSGDWTRLFSRDPLYRQTVLLRDPSRPRTYLALDFWATQEAYQSFRKAHLEDYRALDRECEALTTAERKIGGYAHLPGND